MQYYRFEITYTDGNKFVKSLYAKDVLSAWHDFGLWMNNFIYGVTENSHITKVELLK